MVKSFFVTGTDTDVGKTLVARTLLLEFAAHGLRCAGYKPISAGCARTPDGLRNLDAVLLQEAASLPLPYDLVNPYAYEPPIAPHIAASEARDAITLKGLSDGLRQIEQAGAELVVVEGAGAGSCRSIANICCRTGSSRRTCRSSWWWGPNWAVSTMPCSPSPPFATTTCRWRAGSSTGCTAP
ncbi:hypothetical protein KAM330_30110 [Aeromonas hydrophila]|nr:hypothetical protein KAM330_30110 [Aeromonas hydrophila]